MLNWIKKNSAKRILLLAVSPFLILLFIFLVLFVYFAVRMFDPNYEEFGPQVNLNKSRECADINSRVINNSCKLIWWLESMDIKHPKTLDKVIIEAANAKNLPNLFQRLPKLSGYSKESSGWKCSVDGRLILDNSKEVTRKGTLYKCWPIQ